MFGNVRYFFIILCSMFDNFQVFGCSMFACSLIRTDTCSVRLHIFYPSWRTVISKIISVHFEFDTILKMFPLVVTVGLTWFRSDSLFLILFWTMKLLLNNLTCTFEYFFLKMLRFYDFLKIWSVNSESGD